MKLYSENKIMRSVAWILTFTTATMIAPLDVWAAKKECAHKQLHHAQQSKPKPQPEIRELTATEMTSFYGRGQYRNSYLCGTMPWHRSFHDVNLCTGNLSKSFTDINVSPARGSGLVLQRTYNSNDDRIDGSFGHGWTHAYDIRMEEATSPDLMDKDISRSQQSGDDPTSKMNKSVRADFFGGKHVYKRDADGLYTPPPYMHDWTSSDYKSVLSSGPGDVNSDTEIGLDGTEKHYTLIGDVRKCDYMKDRNGNTTSLSYDTNGNLDTVTDPSGRTLHFSWHNYGDSSTPHWRITQVDGPLRVDGSLQTVSYSYYLSKDEPGAGGEAYNLKTVTLDPNGLNRVTTYTYTTCAGELSLLASITDPNNNTVSYNYGTNDISSNPVFTGTVWVTQITEPGGVDSNGQARSQVWKVDVYNTGFLSGTQIGIVTDLYQGSVSAESVSVEAVSDTIGRTVETRAGSYMIFYAYSGYSIAYDDSNDPVNTSRQVAGRIPSLDSDTYVSPTLSESSQYGRFGNVLHHWTDGFSNADPSNPAFNWNTAYGVDTTNYLSEDYYFQRASTKDMAGNITTFGYGNRYGPLGNRGNLLWMRDARHQQSNSPAYTYEYYQDGDQNQHGVNLCGLKKSETNYNGVVTKYYYDDQWGNLTKIVQDPDDPSTNHTGLNRTTIMEYDEAGHITAKWDPSNSYRYPTDCLTHDYASTVQYNAIGQPVMATFPAPYAETVSYYYGANGRLESMSDSRGTTVLHYEDQLHPQLTNLGDRVASVSDPVTGTISYTYTRRGAIQSKTLPDQTSLHYTYYNAGAYGPSVGYMESLTDFNDLNSFQDTLKEITDDNGRILCVHDYDGYGGDMFNIHNVNGDISACCVTMRFVDHDTQSLHTRGRIMKIVNAYCPQYLTNYEENCTVLSQSEYTYDAVGNRKSNTIILMDENNQVSTRTENYYYDELNRLTSVNYGDGETQTYGYDDMGNRTSLNGEGYTYNAANMLLTKGTTAYTNDANGNRYQTNGVADKVWDSQNRLRECVYNGVTNRFTYGSDGLRRSMTVGNNPTIYYAIDGQNVVQEGHLSNNEFVADVNYLNSSRGVEYREDSNGKKWYLYDGLGSVVAEVTDDNGNGISVTATQKYDAYGAVRGSTGTSDSKHKFVGSLGHTTEPDTGGLIYMQARWYDPLTGRFISEDPEFKGISWYAYCDNNPINRIDQTGKSSQSAYLLGFLACLGSRYICKGFWKAVDKLAGESMFRLSAYLESVGDEMMKRGSANVGAGATEMEYGEMEDTLGLSCASEVSGGVRSQLGAKELVCGALLKMTAKALFWMSEAAM